MDHLILNFTERCNSQCVTCALWRLKEPKTLRMDVIDRLFSSARFDVIRNLYLTGGEPFATDRCIEIARSLHRHHPEAFISGATNAMMPELYVERILAISKLGVPIVPSVSINGSRAAHDNSRGVKGSHDRCIAMMTMLHRQAIPFNVAYLDYGQPAEEFSYVSTLAASFGAAVVVTRFRYSSRYAHDQAGQVDVFTSSFACRAPESLLCIWPNGDVTACEEDDPNLRIGNLHECGLDEMDFAPVIAYVADGSCKPCTMGCFEGK